MKFKLPCFWTVVGNIEIEADTIDEAIEKANAPEMPLPLDGVYLEDSFTVDVEAIEVIQ